jgi:hypothetical protein
MLTLDHGVIANYYPAIRPPPLLDRDELSFVQWQFPMIVVRSSGSASPVSSVV